MLKAIPKTVAEESCTKCALFKLPERFQHEKAEHFAAIKVMLATGQITTADQLPALEPKP